MIPAVLVVPAEGDPGGLLRYGALGARPPVAHRFRHRDVGVWEHSVVDGLVLARPELLRSQELALALWWDGALVPEGWDRLLRVVPDMDGSPRDPTRHGGAAYVLRMLEAYNVLGDCRCSAPYTDGAGNHVPGCAATRPRAASRIVRLARVDGRLVEVHP